MNAQDLERALQAELQEVFDKITVLELIDSTNAEAIRRMQARQEPSQLIVALSQSAGRGRRGRQWLSPPGAGIYFSITHAFNRPLSELQALSLLTALSVAAAVRSYGIENVQLKWPNDVLAERRKLAGILLETCQNGGQSIIIFGIGINLQLPDETIDALDRPVTDVSREMADTDHPLRPEVLLTTVCHNLTSALQQFEELGFRPFKEQWNELDGYLEDEIIVSNGERQNIGTCKGVDESGALLLLRDDGNVQRISGGEVFPSLRGVGETHAVKVGEDRS